MFSKLIWSQINFEDYKILIKKTNEKIKIDGIIDEVTWKECDIGKDFFMITPLDNQKASQFLKQELHLMMIFFTSQ